MFTVNMETTEYDENVVIVTSIETNEFKMEQGLWYIVTHSDKTKTFQNGDLIKLENDGRIINKQMDGWLDSEHVENCVKGLKIELAVDLYKEKIAKHLEQAQFYKNILDRVIP